ncbi:hypothetical protein [Pajaroellobacter abortibovis]|nr:hypothetical protein [Pajaroellobacter abortibovis]
MSKEEDIKDKEVVAEDRDEGYHPADAPIPAYAIVPLDYSSSGGWGEER